MTTRLLRLQRAREHLRDGESASLAHVAREASMSTPHFIRTFAAVFGDTPHQWRTRARLEQARLRLARGDEVTRVCLDLGFSSLGSFSALFTRRVGVAPSVYRRRWITSGIALRDRLPLQQPHCLSLFEAAWTAVPHFSRSTPVPAPACSVAPITLQELP